MPHSAGDYADDTGSRDDVNERRVAKNATRPFATIKKNSERSPHVPLFSKVGQAGENGSQHQSAPPA